MNAEEFKRRFYSFHPKLYRIACALVNNANDAEDILQDAYCKLWSKRSELIAVHQPEAFCVTLVKNLCMDFLRSPRNRISDKMPERATSESTPVQELENKEQVKLVEALIGKLPEKQQVILRMRGCGDCTFEEIENATGESVANVRVLLSRARKTLREMLIKKQ